MDPKPAFSSNRTKRLRSERDDISSDLMDNKSRSYTYLQFDVVADCSDHRFATKAVQQTSKDWTKKIQQEWKILEKDLPETIFVRVFEGRMDLLRAAIIGPAGTPYHDGLFFFDFHFTANYPNEPPKVLYYSGGLRLNPNLYANGTVCLSLLNTWYGRGCEKWDPKRSTMLQILVSIQGLVLNSKPYFNEPGFGWTSHTFWGKRYSLAYNESVFLLSCQTMMYSLTNPQKHFEEFVTEHFCKHGNNILLACRAYLNGVQIGCDIAETAFKSNKGCSKDFEASLTKFTDHLLKHFTAKGVDCSNFLAQNNQRADTEELAAQKAKDDDGSQPKRAANSKWKRFCQYVQKLGKKVLPTEN